MIPCGGFHLGIETEIFFFSVFTAILQRKQARMNLQILCAWIVFCGMFETFCSLGYY